jgi:hypothetical protein
MITSLALLVLIQSAGPRPSGAIRTIERGQTSWVEEPRQAVARTPAQWETLWRGHARERPLPDVDFDKEIVVAVFSGSRPTAGYAVEIAGVKAGGGVTVVQYYESQPRPGMVTAQVITTPFHIVAIPRPPGELIFEKVER